MIMKYLASILFLILMSCGQRKKDREADHSQHEAASSVVEETIYTCPMHPQVQQKQPGTCPICQMELTPKVITKQLGADALQLTAQQMRLGNIQTDTIHSGMLGSQMILTGTLTSDLNQVSSMSIRVMGRVDRLYFKTTSTYLPKGARLLDLYSEELNSAKQEYLLALERKNTFRNETIINFDQLVSSAADKLRLWGVSDAQLRELARTRKVERLSPVYSTVGGYISALNVKEGDYLMEGASLLEVTNLSRVWVEVQLFAAQLRKIQPKAIVEVRLPDFPGRAFKGSFTFMNPEVNPATRVTLGRIELPNQGGLLRPGMPATVIVQNPAHRMLYLPVDAVIRDGKGASVWIQTAPAVFQSRMVTTGMEADDQIEISSGLRDGDVVVVKGAYLLNSEFIFKKGSNPMSGHKM
ncbi:MAG: efflux RND transporter periplasmic adaptor subunit [Sphingobacteriales bacterium]|nr:MAG: efflux RND transporter periplasmic adaptor subunit [Sphingobacteriales bacterium]